MFGEFVTAAIMSESNNLNSDRSTQTKPKRIRQKCSAPDCTNHVVQGGVCVTHGAKRKLCSYPNCAKAAKLAGFCSTHGPARKKCDDPGCTRVAVRAGKCLSHGARRNAPCLTRNNSPITKDLTPPSNIQQLHNESRPGQNVELVSKLPLTKILYPPQNVTIIDH